MSRHRVHLAPDAPRLYAVCGRAGGWMAGWSFTAIPELVTCKLCREWIRVHLESHR